MIPALLLPFLALDPSPIVPPSPTFSDQCVSSVTLVDDLQFQTSGGQGSCMINAVPREISDLRYRDLLWSQDGLFMIFNSFGEGPESQTTGARDFYLFPRVTIPSARQSAPGVIEIRAASGDVFSFDTKTAELTTFSGGTVQITSSVSPTNQGGVEIPSFRGLLLDSGFMMGNQPETNPNAVSEFRDAAGTRCEVKNSEIFSLSSSGNVSFKFSDSELHGFLQTRCPLLNALVLVHP